jgi:ribonuclease-3
MDGEKPRRARRKGAARRAAATSSRAPFPELKADLQPVPEAFDLGEGDVVASALEREEEERPERLAEQLGITFRRLDRLRLALTHRSVVHQWAAAIPGGPVPQSNERLEFLGDAYLGVIVAEYLYNRYPDASEGILTSRRVALVRAERLVAWAREINLGDYLFLAPGERVTEGARDRMLAGAFEALIAAITLDRGLAAARRFLRPFLDRDDAALALDQEVTNPKGRLQELMQELYRVGPVYRIVDAEGPAHARIFTAEVSLHGERLGRGEGVSKRDAEQEAARSALEQLRATSEAESDERSDLTEFAGEAAGDSGGD